jgi:hypothetical protein
MKRIAAITFILAAGFLTAGSAMAQERNVVANIPFAFSLNGRTLPAGHYTIASDFNTPDVLRIEDRQDSVHIMTITMPGAEEAQTNNTLVFHRYGNQYFLTTIRANGASMNCHFTTSKQEKWAKAQKEEASLRIDSDVIIPLQ